jgi:hypothetical protein
LKRHSGLGDKKLAGGRGEIQIFSGMIKHPELIEV